MKVTIEYRDYLRNKGVTVDRVFATKREGVVYATSLLTGRGRCATHVYLRSVSTRKLVAVLESSVDARGDYAVTERKPMAGAEWWNRKGASSRTALGLAQAMKAERS